MAIVSATWYSDPPKALEDCLLILNERMSFLNDQTPEGEALRVLLKRINQAGDDLSKKARTKNPFAFVKFGWEQALKCNAWVWGITWPIDFDANRKGKTATSIFNALLWMLPNDPQWRLFQDYTDEFDRLVHVYPRPAMDKVLRLQKILVKHPELMGDPNIQPYDGANAAKVARLQQLYPECFKSVFPIPPFSEPEQTMWHGAPDNDYHKDIVMKEWKKWLPKAIITRASDYDLTFDLDIRYGNEQVSHWEILCKSYETEDTKWSGAAVTGILLTEGLKLNILNEIRQRFKNDGFGHWDYTPYEPRNVGKKTMIAHKIMKGKIELPLRPFIFTGFGIEGTPAFILPAEKRADLIRMWTGSAEGEARLKGKFFSSSPIVLTNLDKDFQTLPWTKEQLFSKFPNGNLYRGLDPGYDHPTACAWGLLSNVNTWYIYQVYSQAGTSIPQRCEDIIKLSGNDRRQKKWGRGPDDYIYEEFHPSHKSQAIITTLADYHVFKTDENTKAPYSVNYIKQGLVITPSVTTGPRERAQIFDQLLQPDLTKPHPLKNRPPGCKVYFLINEPGVAAAFEKLENIFWDRYRSGDRVGEPKDQIQDHEDDELDAISYLVCAPHRWQHYSHSQLRRETKEPVAMLQQQHRTSAFAITG